MSQEDYAYRRRLGAIIGFLFLLEFFYGFLSDVGRYHSGHSAMSFILLYLIARYFRLYPNKFTLLSSTKCFALYIVFTIIPTIIAVYRGFSGNMLNYDSPFVIVAALSMLIAFSKIQIHSSFINWVACSAFSVYLLHQHALVVPRFKDTMMNLWLNSNGILYVAICILLTLLLFVVGVVLDKVRIFLFIFICKISKDIIESANIRFLK